MITGINESKTLTKHISWACKYTFDGMKCNLNHWWNSDKCRCECKKHNLCENYYIGILLHVVVKIENIFQVLWLIQRLYVMKAISTNFVEKKK